MFVKPGDAQGLAASIERLVREPELLEKLARNSRKAYEKYFTVDRFGTEFLELVEEAISSAHGQPETAATSVRAGEMIGSRR